MDQVRNRPKIIQSIKDFQNPQNKNQDIKKIKKQVSVFVNQVQNQFSKIIIKYEKQVNKLKKQKEDLKQSKKFSAVNSSPKKSLMNTNAFTKQQEDINFHTLQLNSKSIFKGTETKSIMLKSNLNTQQFPKWTSEFQIKKAPTKYLSKFDINNYFPNNDENIEKQSQKNNCRSKYQIKSSNKKHHEQQIVDFLQQRSKQLNDNTNKMLALIGRNVNLSQSESENKFEQNYNNKSQNYNSKDFELNRSLSQICQSLNNSFIAQKARKSKQKVKKAEQLEKKKKKQQEEKNQKMRKQRALKNLLSRLRQNANSTNQPQIVKGSKLLPTGKKNSIVYNPQKAISIRKNSKVLINPIPVSDNSHHKRQTSPNLNKKNPTSILKNSSNILTRSIAGISAISFDD